MSIARDITGAAISDGSDKLFSLLALVSNPKVYEAKVKELQDLTAQNKKYVDAVGPVDDIVRLRNEAAELHKAARAKAEEAEKAAAEALKNAQAEAAAVIAAAKEAADKLAGEAKAATKKANDLTKKSTDRATALDAREAELGKLAESLRVKDAALVKALADAEVAKNEAAKAKDDLLAKHKAFLQGL